MPDAVPPPEQAAVSPDQGAADEEVLREFAHPRGTLAIVTIFAVLFALGWLFFYLDLYLGRGATH